MEGIQKIWPKWEPVEVLGKGGFGTVYKCKRENFGEVLWSAIKVVKIPNDDVEIKEMTSSGFSPEQIKAYYQKSVKALVDEIRMMDTMKSASHIVGIEDFEVVEMEDGIGWKVYIRMELLTNLQDYLAQNGVSQDEIIKMALHILNALEHCHQLNIVHRDIKPANIFVSRFGEYKLGDFGISRQVERNNATMSQKGTKSYMAPEMIRLGKYGQNVDLYALGLTMYELLNHGRMPFLPPYPELFFPDDREEAMMKRLMGEPFPEIDGIGELNTIIQKACHYDPNLRYQSATQMKKDLMNLGHKNDVVEEQTMNIFTSEDKTMNVFGNEEKTMNIFESNNIFVDNDQTMNVFEKDLFIFEDSVVMNNDAKYAINQNDTTYYFAFTNGYYDLNNQVITTSIDTKTTQLKFFFEQYLSSTNKIEALENMIKLETNAKLCALLGDEYYKNRKTTEAQQWYEKAYRLDEADSYILKRMACLKYMNGQFKEAIELAKKGIENFHNHKSSTNLYVVHTLYFIQAMCYQALNDEVNAVRAISDLYDFNFTSYHAGFLRGEELIKMNREFNQGLFLEKLLTDERCLDTKHKIVVAGMNFKIGGQLFKKHLTSHIHQLKETYLKNPSKLNKLKAQFGVDFDEIYIYVTTTLFGNALFGQYGIYKLVDKKLYYTDYFGISHMIFGSYDSSNLLIKKISDYKESGWRTIISGANKNTYLFLSLCELKHEIVQKTTLPLDAPFDSLWMFCNTRALIKREVQTIGDFVQLSDEKLRFYYPNERDYLYMKGLQLEL